ncbi:sugar ABC transporter permease [Paenibacillus psychroresistens]|uniref:Sugar ABC transporter permease n=2 Tax=Paenibacillus psychroresistens TaxID=1778678 RepID=A0A6B8RTS4_9BACL|nr:sugar ABC transporter permease [Paenibacillus psychroresistens]
MGMRNTRLYLLLLALPFIGLVFIFNYVPLFGWIYAFFDYKPGIPLSNSPFVGFKYFELAFHEGSDLWKVMRNTLVLSLLTVVTTPLPVIFAIFLNEIRSPRFRKLVQTMTTIPNFISWILVFSIFFTFFSVDGGVVNSLLLKWGWIQEPTNLLANDKWAWIFQTIITVWKTVGFSAIIYIAAMAGIDPELYQAAKVDGAGRFSIIWNVTVPGLLPTFFVMLMLAISNMLSNGFEQYYVFYNSLVSDRLQVLDYYVYKIGLLNNDYSFSTALGVFKTVISILLLFIVNGLSKRLRGQSII